MLRQFIRPVCRTSSLVSSSVRQCSEEAGMRLDNTQDRPQRSFENDRPQRSFERSFSRVTIIGRVGNKPTVDEDTNEVVFKVGVSNFPSSQKVDWHSCCVSELKSNTTDKAQKLEVGDRVLIEGSLFKLTPTSHVVSVFNFNVLENADGKV